MGREGKKAKAKLSKAKQKASSKKKDGRGSYASGVDVSKLRHHLASLGCQLVTIESDGNCLFRTLSDQIHGDQSYFGNIRQRIIEYIKEHQEDLEPFMEDEEKFDHYCKRMAEDGVWGGNLELYVAAQVWKRNIVVHQVDGNRTTIECGEQDADSYHVCYYNDEHYDSVRSREDDLTGSPLPIELDIADSSKICVAVDPNEKKKDGLDKLIEDYPNMPEDELISLWKQFNCDENRTRQKLSKSRRTHTKKRR